MARRADPSSSVPRWTAASRRVQPPQQERSRASFERVIQAATALLEEDGYDGFTLAEVSKRANVSIGSIYARVKSKDDLFYVIQDRYMTVTENRPRLQRPGRLGRPRAARTSWSRS